MRADNMRAQALAARVPGLLMVVGADVAAALDDERRQTQRRMIAALYWRAGEALRAADYCQQSYGKGSLEVYMLRHNAEQIRATAATLEAAL